MVYSLKFCVLVFIFFSSLVAFGYSTGQTSRLSGFYVPTTKLRPYYWTYIRVELRLNFSSATIAIDSDVNLDLENLKKHSKEKLPIICFRDGGPPLPDFSRASLRGLVINHYNVSAGNVQYLQNGDQCYSVQKRLTFKMPYGQFTPGGYYAGLFNGLGNIRTQSYVIKRGSTYSFSANITVEGCLDPTKKGQYCDQTVEDLQKNLQNDGILINHTRNLCLVNMEPKLYSLDIFMPIQVTAKAKYIAFNRTLSTKNIAVGNEVSIMCHARCNGIPDVSLYDYSSNLSKSSLVIPVPKCPKWYFSIQAVYQPEFQEEKLEEEIEVCLSIEWEVI